MHTNILNTAVEAAYDEAYSIIITIISYESHCEIGQKYPSG